MTKFIMYVHMGFPLEYETQEQIRQLRFICHCELRRGGNSGDLKGQEGSYLGESKASVW